MEPVLPHNNSLNDNVKLNDLNVNNLNGNLHNGKDYNSSDTLTESYIHHLHNEVQEIKDQNIITAEHNIFFKDVLEKLDQLTSRCDSLEQTCVDLEEKNDRLSREILYEQAEKEEMKKQVLNITALTNTLKLDALRKEARVAKQVESETQTEEIFKFDAKLDIVVKQIETLEKLYEGCNQSQLDVSARLTDLEFELQLMVRRHSLILKNFCPREDSSAQEMFIVFVKNVLKVSIDDADIEALHVISKHEDPSIKTSVVPRDMPRPILITFTCYAIKARIYRAWLSYRTSNDVGTLSIQKAQGLSIQEYLGEISEATYNEALILKDKNKISDVWTFKGKTFIRDLKGDIKEFESKCDKGDDKKGYSCILM